MSNGTKACRGCARDIPLSGFAADRNRSDGLRPRCRACVAAYGAGHYRRRQAADGKAVRDHVEVPAGRKLCRQCGEVKPHAERHKNASASDGLSTRCEACRAVEGRAGHFKRAHGITEADRDAMIAAQGGVCVLCRKAPAEHVDHDHQTGSVRGVLCFSCNAALGQFKDRPDVIRRAAAYVEGNLWNPTLVAQGVYRQPS
ncbi:endonuclease VII domain-containing protein [Streptomyces sp. G-G2]|uniref:endonuclease VII domain-containing protein n=1 Tax=Streptomyces sp. G-G2 TaxID=3046201 RepID=UPI0024B99E84|nr:endonuclease VII domain-containing protein [Streptomyces sp. G-G2]MDJ0381624.1 endonuclease VII domain-containing protein [Streptomyces sp. G-G2]